MRVVCGSTSRQLGKALASLLYTRPVNVETKRFPDSELYVRVTENLRDESVLLVQNCYPDEKIVELFLLQNAINEYEVEELITLIPYYGYARQDRMFNEGEAISAKALAGHFELDTDKVITVDIHTTAILEWFDIDSYNVSAMPAIGKYLKKTGVDVIVSPDRGGVERARLAAENANCEFDYLEKKRIDSERVEMTPVNFEVLGKRVAIVDDIISTGGTIRTAAQSLKKKGAKIVTAACTHGLFIGDSLLKLKTDCDVVISTDTIENKTTTVSVADEVLKVLKEI